MTELPCSIPCDLGQLLLEDQFLGAATSEAAFPSVHTGHEFLQIVSRILPDSIHPLLSALANDYKMGI